MSDFLDSLVERSFGTGPVLQPRLPSRFEPSPGPQPSTISEPAALEASSEDEYWDDSLPGVDSSAIPPQLSPLGASAGVAQTEVGPRIERWSPIGGPSVRGALTNTREAESSSDTPKSPTGTSTALSSELRRGPYIDEPQWLHHRLDELRHELFLLGQTAGRQDDHQSENDRRERETRLAEPSMKPVLPVFDQTGDENPLESVRAVTEDSAGRFDASMSTRGASADAGLSAVPRERPVISSRPSEFPLQSPPSPPQIVPESLPRRSETQAAPTINVTIGRVEVKAIRDAPPPLRREQRGTGTAVMSLAEYLERRAAGRA